MIGVDDSNDPHPSADVHDRNGAGLPDSRLENDDMFDALNHERRRYLLYTLLEDEAWSLREIAAKLAAWENDATVDTVGRDEVEKTYASLYHAHVPKLLDYGIVDFERSEGTVTRGPNAMRPLAILENIGGSESQELESHARTTDHD